MELLAQHHQQLIDQFELSLELVGLVARHIVEDACELARDDVGQKLGGAALDRRHIRAARIEG